MKPDFIIFSDATLNKKYNKTSSGDLGYGAVILNTRTKKHTTLSDIIPGNSIALGEAWAMYEGLRFIEHIRKKYYGKQSKLKILVVSDSKVTVDALNEYIVDRWDVSDWYNWKTVGNTEVKYQSTYRRIWALITNGYLIVRFVHLRSHSKHKPDIQMQIFKELKAAGIRVSNGALNMFIEMNDMADSAARQALIDYSKLNAIRLSYIT